MPLGTRISEIRKNEETSNAGNRWFIEEDNKLVEEIENSKVYEEIALNHKRTILSIKLRVISQIIYPKYKDDIENDIEKISMEYNIDTELIMKYINKIKTTQIIQKSIISNRPDKKEILEYLQNLDNKINDINTKIDILFKNLKLYE
jgi:hypothetical protein